MTGLSDTVWSRFKKQLIQVRSKTARVALVINSHGWLSRAVAETTEFDSEFVAGTFVGDIEGRICFI